MMTNRRLSKTALLISIAIVASALVTGCVNSSLGDRAHRTSATGGNIQIALLGFDDKRVTVYINDIVVFDDVVHVEDWSIGLAALFRANASGLTVFKLSADGIERSQTVDITRNTKTVYMDLSLSDFILTSEDDDLALY
jgi:hypothetical protein